MWAASRRVNERLLYQIVQIVMLELEIRSRDKISTNFTTAISVMDYTGECDVSIHPTAEEKWLISGTQTGETSREDHGTEKTTGVKRKAVGMRDDGRVKRQKTRRSGGQSPKPLPRTRRGERRNAEGRNGGGVERQKAFPKIRRGKREDQVRDMSNAGGRDLRHKLRRKEVEELPMKGERRSLNSFEARRKRYLEGLERARCWRPESNGNRVEGRAKRY